ncbi:MAG: DUF3850 domain-containing protein [Clostridiales bacterium]|nr:DUF3850 domain-containing protein [Clostridiales bacterium]
MENKLHELKITSIHFNEVATDRKNFEIRKNDRSFEIGDKVKLREYIGVDHRDMCVCIDSCKTKSLVDCPFHRKDCLAYNAHAYTGNYVLATITDVFDINDVIPGYVAFNFVIDKKTLSVNKIETELIKGV